MINLNRLKVAWIFWGISLIFIIAGLIFFSTIQQKKYKPYKEIEKDIMNVSKKYIEINGWYPKKGDSDKILFSDLIDKGLIGEVVVLETEDKCDGYVLVKNTGVVEYKTYMKCKKYTTSGYEKD